MVCVPCRHFHEYFAGVPVNTHGVCEAHVREDDEAILSLLCIYGACETVVVPTYVVGLLSYNSAVVWFMVQRLPYCTA